MAYLEAIAVDLGKSIVELFLIMRGKSHGIFQGTAEAVLAEAQGAQIGPKGFSHIDDLRATGKAVATREDALNRAINNLAGISSQLSTKVREICRPLLDQSGRYRQAIAETERTALELQRTDGGRLKGVVFGEGGMGPEVGREARALISTQMQQRARELSERGIEPRLIPSIRTASQGVLQSIRQLPMNANEAVQKLMAIIASMRIAVTRAASQALLAGEEALVCALGELGVALARISGKLTTPFFVLDLDRLMREIGLTPDPAAS